MLGRPGHYVGDGGGVRRLTATTGTRKEPKISFYACVSNPLRQRGKAGAVTEDFLMASEMTNNVPGGFMKKYSTEQEAVKHLLDRARGATRRDIEFPHQGMGTRGRQQARSPRGTGGEGESRSRRGDGVGIGSASEGDPPLHDVPSVVEEIDEDPVQDKEATERDLGLPFGGTQASVETSQRVQRSQASRRAQGSRDGGEERRKRRGSPNREGSLGRFEPLLRLVVEHVESVEAGGPSPLDIERMDGEARTLLGELRARLGQGQHVQRRAMGRAEPSAGLFGRLLLQ